MMTWFDVLLITMLALITTMAMQRGLVGLLWGVGAALACLVCNLLTGAGALLAAVVLGSALAYGSQQLLARRGAEVPLWEALLGGVGGVLFGLIFILSLSLSFPGQGVGRSFSYPSSRTLPAPLYEAIRDSELQTQLRGIWRGSPLLRRWLIPDQVQRKASSQP